MITEYMMLKNSNYDNCSADKVDTALISIVIILFLILAIFI